MNREHLSYVLGKLVCWMRRKHDCWPKFKAADEKYYKKCVVCGITIQSKPPKRRVERRT